MVNPSPTAQIALLALSAAAELPSLPDRYFLDDGRTPFSQDTVLELLASLKKPIAVQPVPEEGGLRLVTGPVARSEFSRHHSDRIARIAAGGGFLRFLADRYSGSLDDLVVLCRGAGAEARATVAQFYAFQREYLVDCSNTIGGDFSDAEGVAAVIKFSGGGEGGSLEQVTPAA